MQVRYDPAADRILWQLRTHAGELFAAWLTRRMTLGFWGPFQNLVAQANLPASTQPTSAAAAASITPEAREMLAQAARQRPLPGAEFNQPFNPQPAAQPLGPEPLLPHAIDLGPRPDGPGLALRLRDGQGRSLSMQLNSDLSSALLRLMDRAITEADWGIGTPAAAPTPDAPPAAPRVLN